MSLKGQSKAKPLLIGCITLAVFALLLFLGERLAFGISVTKDLLYGYGDFESQTRFDSFDYSAANEPVWDTVGAASTARSVKVYYSRVIKQDLAETTLIDHQFLAPDGTIGTPNPHVSFFYKVANGGSGPTTITAKVYDPSTWTSVWTGTLVSTTSSVTSFTQVGADVSGLVPNKNYILRLEVYMYPSQGTTTTVNIDQINLTATWTDNAGPIFKAVSPLANTYCQGTAAPLKAIVADPAGVKSVQWEYRVKDSGSLFTPIAPTSTVSKTEVLGTDTFTNVWDTTGLATGEYEVRLTATDDSGGANTSQTSIIYKVDNVGPAASGFDPVDNSVVAGYTQALKATASDWSKVSEVTWEYWDGDSAMTTGEWVLIGTAILPESGTDASGVYSTIWHTTNVKDGAYKLRIRAKDRSPAKVESVSAIITYQVDNLKPKIEAIVPEQHGYVRGSALNLSAQVPADYDGNGIASVQWFYSADEGASWNLIGMDTTGTADTYSVTWDTTAVPERTYDMKIVAANVFGQTGEASFEYTVDNTSPVLVSAGASSVNLVTVLFDEVNIDSPSATNPANYTIYETGNPTRTLTISAAIAKGDGKGVKLTTSNQTENTGYTVDITGTITDKAGNPLTGSTSTTFVGSGNPKGNPHGGYAQNSAWCGTCHVVHSGQAEKLMTKAEQSLVCYICHDDSGLSVYDVKKEFGSVDPVGANTSHHPVPEDTQKCVTCHNPHAEYGSTNPMLLQTTDVNSSVYKTGNDVCWTCHGSQLLHGSTVVSVVGVPEIDDKQTYYSNDIGLDGGPVGVHADRGNPLLAAPTYAGINCDSCHVPHGSTNPKLFKTVVNGNVVYGNSDDFCLSCHIASTTEATSFLGKEVWENTTYSAHSRDTTGALWPGGGYGVDRTADAENRGKCINCHNVHGTPYGLGLVGRFTVPAYNDKDALTNYGICFQCHGPVGVGKGVTTKNMTPYYQSTYPGTGTFGGTQGHFIKSSGRGYLDSEGRPLEAGWKIPCIDCHNTHGSVGENRFLLKGNINGDNFTHLFKGTALSGRQFCVQCHRYSDDARGPAPYRGGTIALMPGTNPQHASTGTIECNYCHGGGDLVKGAHAPNSGRSEGGLDCNLCHLTMAGEMGTSSTLNRHQMTHFEADQPVNKYDASTLGAMQSKTCLSTCHTDHDVFNADPDGAKRYLRASGGDVSGVPAAISSAYSVVDNTYLGKRVAAVSGLCMTSVCHGTNGSLDDVNYESPSGYSGTSDLYTQVTSTKSTHAISANPTNTYVNANTLTPEFWATWNARTEKRLICTDCHEDQTTGVNFDLKRQGPHSSTNLYMLKATGNVNSGYQTYDSLCNLCHQNSVYGGNGIYGTGLNSRAAAVHAKPAHYTATFNRSGCLGCHAGNRQGFGSVGATRGSVHGTNSTDKFLNGNYISSHPIGSNSCSMQTNDPGGARCNAKHPTAQTY